MILVVLSLLLPPLPALRHEDGGPGEDVDVVLDLGERVVVVVDVHGHGRAAEGAEGVVVLVTLKGGETAEKKR